MLRFVTLFGALALAVAAPQPNVFQIDLEPEEAAKYVNSPPFTEPQLSGRTAVLPLVKYNDPRFRAADAGPTLGHYWKNGQEIENPDDYVEEVYNAAQYHGQDGLGAYAYGYETPESSKVENKQRSGDVSGSYIYRAGTSNDIIKVRYWADSQGFHQEDNIPKVVLKPVEEAPEVREARLAHEKAWQAAAYANLHPGAAAAANGVNPPQSYFDAYNDFQSSASEQQDSLALPPSKLREGKAYGQLQNQQYQNPQYQNQQYQNQQFQKPQFQNPQYQNQQFQNPQYQNQQYQNQQSQQQNQYGNTGDEQFSTTTTTEEPTGPPRGFFYSFEYPVSIITSKSSLEGGSVNPGVPVDQDTVSVGQK